MDNKQKLEYILTLERRDKRKKMTIGIIIVLMVGAAVIFSQYKNISF